MALDTIRKRLDEDYNAGHLLDSLPSHNSIRCVDMPAARSGVAITIGNVKGRDILAFLVQLGDKPREVRYCSIPSNSPVQESTLQVLLQDDVVRLPLNSPFKYNADTSKSSKRKFSIVIKWYFMLKGLLHDGVGGDSNDYCKRFFDALKKIDLGRQADEGKSIRPKDYTKGSRETPTTIDESSEPDEPRGMYKLRSAPRKENTKAAETDHPMPPQQLATPTESASTSSKDGDTDYDKLCRYLDSHGILYLLKNIPEADAVQFVTQSFLPGAQSKKLFIGRHVTSDSEIYAYMRAVRGWHEINFWVEDPQRPFRNSQMRTEDVSKQRIFHPFNKTYSKDGPVDQGDRARLTLMVKWYFIASGIASHVILQETKAYPERLRSALEYIAHRMGPAAFSPETSSTAADAQQQDHQVSTHLINESQIQTSLAAPTSCLPEPQPAPASVTQITHTNPSPRGTKRPLPATTEDADFASLTATLLQDQTLTKKINAIDQELEMLEMQKQNFLERLEKQKHNFLAEWERQYDEVVGRRIGVENERGGVRKRFKRMSLKVAVSGEE